MPFRKNAMHKQESDRRFQPPASLARPAVTLIAALALLMLHSTAQADDESKPDWTLGGFGSVGVVHSNERYANFTASPTTPGSAGFTHRWSADVDSRLGAQLDVNLSPRWSAVLQLVSERGLDHSYTPKVEWANIKYQYSADFSVRLGRIALPVFINGDYRKAGYALPWVRPAVEVYGMLPISNSDGVDASYRWSVGEFKNVTQLFYGYDEVKISDTANAKASNLAGLSNTTTYGALSVRASVLTTKLDVNVARPLFDAFRQFGPQGAALAERYDIDGKRTSVANLGFNYDPGNWFLMGELARMIANSYLGNNTAFYLSSGYRIGNLTPYITYSQVKTSTATSDPGLSLTGLPPQFAFPAAGLNAGLNQLLSTIAIQHTVTLGARWDFMPNVALKLQFDHLRPQGGSSGTLIKVQPGFSSGHGINVMSAVLDFVF